MRGKALRHRARAARRSGWAAGARPPKGAPLCSRTATRLIFFPRRATRGGWSSFARCASEHGRDLDDPQKPWTPALHLFVNLRENEDEALDDGAENLSMRYGMDMREAAKRYLLHGSVERCAERIQGFWKAGVRHFIFKVAAPAGEEMEHMLRLAQELLPEVRRHAG